MTQTNPTVRPVTDWLTLIALAAISVSLTVAFHEGIHALTCVVLGGSLLEYSALHVDCAQLGVSASKVVSGSASIANLILGTVCWLLLPRIQNRTANVRFFVWLFMLMNWLNGAGYWMFSGASNFGDWAAVIKGWEPHGLWRGIMFVGGSLLFLLFVWLALQELGKIIGGTEPEQIGRATKLGMIAYFTAVLIIALAGALNPYGFLGAPSIAGILAAAGALSPLLWMMQWFRAKSFVKVAGPPLAISRNWGLIAAAVVTTFVYVAILGPTIYF